MNILSLWYHCLIALNDSFLITSMPHSNLNHEGVYAQS